MRALTPTWGPGGRDALEGNGPQRRFQKRLNRRSEEVAEAAGGGYCRLQMPLRMALGVRGTVAGHRLGALEGGGGYLPPFPPSGASLPGGQAVTRGYQARGQHPGAVIPCHKRHTGGGGALPFAAKQNSAPPSLGAQNT